MAVAATHRSSVGFDLSASQSMVRRIKQYVLYRRSVAELRNVPARDLRDLGISRSEIKAVAWASVYGNKE